MLVARIQLHEEFGEHQERAVPNGAVDRSKTERGGFEVRLHAFLRDGDQKTRDEDDCEQEDIDSVPVVVRHKESGERVMNEVAFW